VRQVSDLKGKAVSFPAPTALAAAIMPQYYLQTHGIDVMKDIEMDDADDAAIIGMSRSLRLTTIAEGVETIEQYRQLKALDCAELQGYLVAKPMTVEACEAWMRSAAVGNRAEAFFDLSD